MTDLLSRDDLDAGDREDATFSTEQDHPHEHDRRAATTLPRRPLRAAPTPRPIGGFSSEDLFVLVGAVVSAMCVTLLVFGRLTPLSGRVGFAIVFFASFVAIYAALVSIGNERVAVIDRVMSAVMTGAAVLAVGALSSVVIYVFVEAWQALFRWNMFTEDMRRAGPLEELDVGGLAHAISGSVIMMSICLVLTVPLAIGCAVYLNESTSRLADFVRSVVTAMTALPSIVAGLFILVVWILLLGNPRSGFAASLAISLMMLPIIVRSGDVVLRLVPGSLREAAAALGAPQWRVVWHVVLPTARSGLTTSVLLGVARGIGETAPVLLTSGNPQLIETNPTQPMMSLPLFTFTAAKSGVPNLIARGFASAAVLMLLVLLLFSIARALGGRPAGQLSKGQAKRAASRSARDLDRFEQRQRTRLAANGADPDASVPDAGLPADESISSPSGAHP